jgi:heme oxygenase
MSLRENTAIKHKEAESHPFNRDMVAGKLKAHEYYYYVRQMHFLFHHIERRLGDTLPKSMLRNDAMLKDIEELLFLDQGRYTVSLMYGILGSTTNYYRHICDLKEEDLMPHVYLNYLALLFGGQIIKKSVPGSGTMYDFENPNEAIAFVRSQQTDEWTEEVNKGFDYLIAIYDELQDFFGRNI